MPVPCSCIHQHRVHNLGHCRKCECTMYSARIVVCEVQGCGRSARNGTLCNRHGLKVRRHGDALYGRTHGLPPETRFWAQVNKTETCWEWTGALDALGYARFRDHAGARKGMAHRWAYEHTIGPIPDGLELDHLCRNRKCVRPIHLEPVTHAENMHRSYWAQQTTCRRGHPFPPNGKRVCRICANERNARYRAKTLAEEGIQVEVRAVG